MQMMFENGLKLMGKTYQSQTDENNSSMLAGWIDLIGDLLVRTKLMELSQQGKK